MTFNSTTFNLSVGNTVTATHFDNVSDRNLKTDIQTLNETESLNILEKLNPVSFVWKNNGEKSFGFIAQEVENILPNIVHTRDKDLKTLSYVQLIPFLVSVINKQQEQINKLTLAIFGDSCNK